MGKFLDKYFWTVAKWGFVVWLGWEAIVFLWTMIIPVLSFFHVIAQLLLWFTIFVVMVAVVIGFPMFFWKVLYEMKRTLDGATAMQDSAAAHEGDDSRYHAEPEGDQDEDDWRREPRRSPLLTEYDHSRPSPHRRRTPFVGDED